MPQSQGDAYLKAVSTSFIQRLPICPMPYHPASLFEPETAAGPTRLPFVGRITPHKGHKHLNAVAALRQRGLHQKVAMHFVDRPEAKVVIESWRRHYKGMRRILVWAT